MIRIDVDLKSDGTLRCLSADGHALRGGDSSFSPVCAAVSSALRSTARVLLAHPGLKIEGEAPEEGVFRIEVLRCAWTRRGYLLGVSSALLGILQDLAAENPNELQLNMRSKTNGS